jgi:hypothetical protein
LREFVPRPAVTLPQPTLPSGTNFQLGCSLSALLEGKLEGLSGWIRTGRPRKVRRTTSCSNSIGPREPVKSPAFGCLNGWPCRSVGSLVPSKVAVDCKNVDRNDWFSSPRLGSPCPRSPLTRDVVGVFQNMLGNVGHRAKTGRVQTGRPSACASQHGTKEVRKRLKVVEHLLQAGRIDLPHAQCPQRWARQLAPRARATSPPACGVFLSRLAFIPAASSRSTRAILWAARVLCRSGFFPVQTTLGARCGTWLARWTGQQPGRGGFGRPRPPPIPFSRT